MQYHGMGITGINPSSDMLPMNTMAEGSEDKARVRRATLRFTPPLLRFVRNHCVIGPNLAASRPTGGSMLTVPDSVGFDTVK